MMKKQINITNQMPLVSVIIPCYNYGEYLLEAIDSARRSTYPNIEVIVVNDGSTDPATLEVLNQLPAEIKVIHQHNQGLPAARNTGFRAAQGKYVLPLDADDMIAKTYIEIGTWLMEQQQEISFVYGYVQLFGTENYIWYTGEYSLWELLGENIIPAGSLVRKSVWAAVGGYDESMRGGYEDWEFWIRLGRNGYYGYRVKDTLFYYRQHGPSMLTESNKRRSQLIGYIRKKHANLYYNPMVRLKMYYITLARNLPRFLHKIPRISRALSLFSKAARLGKDVHYLPWYEYQRQIAKNCGSTNLSKRALGENSDKTPILIILPWLEVGGVEQVFYNIISQLDRTKLEIYIVTTLQGQNSWKDKFTDITDGIFHLPAIIKNHEQAGKFILDLIQQKNIKVVQISNSKLGYYYAPLIKKTYPGIKVIDLLHSDDPEAPWDYFRVSDLVKEFIDKRIVITEQLKNILIKKFQEKSDRIEVIYNGIDLTPFSVGLLPEKKQRILNGRLNVAFVGRLSEEKNPLKFLAIARRLIQQKHQVHFMVIGDGPLRSDIEKYIDGNQLREYITVLGFRDDVPALLLHQIDLLIAPSRREGFPVTGIESFAAGVPIIAADVPGWQQIIEEGVTGHLISGEDVEGFSNCFLKLQQNRELILSMSEKCRIIAKVYDCQSMAKGYQNIFLT